MVLQFTYIFKEYEQITKRTKNIFCNKLRHLENGGL